MKKIKSFPIAIRAMAVLYISIFLIQSAEGQVQPIDYFKEGISPQVALMNRYGDYPVDYITGLVDITVPLYMIQTPGLSIPLELKFHPSGLRADEQEGLLGVRWVLGGLGHISRIIRGYPDENTYYPFNEKVNTPNYTPDFYDLYGTTSTRFSDVTNPNHSNSYFESGFYNDYNVYMPGGKYKDTEYDIYSYSLPNGKNGKFIYTEKNDQGKAYPMPYEPMIILPFKIVDEDGVIYNFGENGFQDCNRNDQITCRYLTSIISANKQDTITIEYQRPLPVFSTTGWIQSLVLSHQISQMIGTFYKTPEHEISPLMSLLGDVLTTETEFFKSRTTEFDLQKVTWEAYVPKSIQFTSGGKLIGKVSFNYQSLPNHNSREYLKEMIVTGGNNAAVRKIDFTLEKSTSQSFAFLKHVSFGENGRYSFDYYPGYIPLVDDIAKYPDWWGYYSDDGGWFCKKSFLSHYYYCSEFVHGASGIPASINLKERPFPGHKRGEPSNASKEARGDDMKRGMIYSIRYPTGGQTLFEYEANGYTNSPLGGLRIAQIINRSESGKSETKRYEYKDLYTPGYLEPPRYSSYKNIYIENEIEGRCIFIDRSVHPDAQIQDHSIRFIQKQFLPTFPADYTLFRSNIVYYGEVTEFLDDNSGQKIKTVYRYDIKPLEYSYYDAIDGDVFRGEGTQYQHGYVSPTDFWHGNKLIGKSVYRGTNNNEYREIKRYEYDYEKYMIDALYDLPVYRYRKHLVSYWLNGDFRKQETEQLEMIILHPEQIEKTFAFKRQKYTIGADRLKSQIERTFDEAGRETKVTKTFTYDPTYLLPRTETVTNSDGKTATVSYSYPFDHHFSPYDEMVNGITGSYGTRYNILSPVVEKRIVYADNFWEAHKTDYVLVQDNKKRGYYPQYVRYSNTSGYSFDQLYFGKYSPVGRPLQMTRDNSAENIVYLWSYHHQYPVAAIRNATYAEVNTALGGGTFIDDLAGTMIPTDVQWSKINNLRTALPNALVTTCTYKPLVGKLSETNPAGTTTYYEYDTAGRLQEIYLKNNTGQKEILEAYRYNYVNQ